MRKWCFAAACAAVIFFCFVITSYADEIKKIEISLSKSEAAISFLNLPDGEATLVQGYKKNILINTGDEDSQTDLDDQLKKLGIKTIDTLILTNPQGSYSGNVHAVVKKYDISKILTSKDIKKEFCADSKSLCYLVDVLDHQSHFLFRHLKMRVLDESPCGEMNILFTYGNTTLYYMGFTDEKSQKKRMKHPFRASIIKVSHYGAGKQVSPELLKKLDPEIAILFHKDEIKPNQDFLNNLATEWVETYHLPYVGTLTIHLTPEAYELAPFFND